jgi:hypothetical protein
MEKGYLRIGRKALLIPILRKGDKKQYKNYREITLLSHCLKYMNKNLKLTRHVENKLGKDIVVSEIIDQRLI